MNKLLLLLCGLSMLSACTPEPEKKGFVQKVEAAHQKTSFLSHEGIRFDLKLTFGGKERLNGKVSTLTSSGKGLIEYKDGKKIYQINEKVYYSPQFETNKGIRFDAFTWTYFFLFPYKLSDQGTVWSKYAYNELNDTSFLTRKLTFEEGIGDAPKDWYVIYANEKEYFIEVAAYIVTAHKTVEEAEKDPHAIKYEDYQLVEGVPVATKWTFWVWDEKKGLTKQLGEARLSNIEFFSPEKGYFHPPLDFEEAK